MAGIFRDGFDSYSGTAAPVGLGAKYTVANTPTLVSGRFGGQALQCVGSTNVNITGTLSSSVSSLTLHAGVKVTSGASTVTRTHLAFLNGGTFTLAFTFSSSGEIIVYRATGVSAGTELGRTATSTFLVNVWYSLAIEMVISDAAGRVTVYLDGTQVLNLTSVDTNNGVTTVNTVQIGTSASLTGTIIFDDVYITDSATKLTNHPRIETLVPTSDGATLNFTPSTGTSHYALVDELPASTTDYLSGSNVGDLDILNLGDLSTTPLSIEEVCIVGYLAKTDAASRSLALGVISGVTTSDGSNFSLNSTGLRHERPLATDPNTSAAWTASGVNALALQPKVTV